MGHFMVIEAGDTEKTLATQGTLKWHCTTMLLNNVLSHLRFDQDLIAVHTLSQVAGMW